LIDVDDLATPEENSLDGEESKSKGRRPSKIKAGTKLPKLTMPTDSNPPDNPTSAVPGSANTMTPTEGMSARQLNVLKRKAKANKSSSSKYSIKCVK
jgi:hypothetical protein